MERTPPSTCWGQTQLFWRFSYQRLGTTVSFDSFVPATYVGASLAIFTVIHLGPPLSRASLGRPFGSSRLHGLRPKGDLCSSVPLPCVSRGRQSCCFSQVETRFPLKNPGGRACFLFPRSLFTTEIKSFLSSMVPPRRNFPSSLSLLTVLPQMDVGQY